MSKIGLGVDVPQESRSRADASPCSGLRFNVHILDLKQVARFGALDVDGPGQRMADFGVERVEIGLGGVRFDLAV